MRAILAGAVDDEIRFLLRISPWIHQTLRMERTCNSCGSPAAWLVIFPYSQDGDAGRVMSYCASCRASNASLLSMAVPWTAFDLDPIGVMAVLYGQGLTRTAIDPSPHLALPAGPWPAMLEMAGLPTGKPAIPDELAQRHHAFFEEKKWQRLLRLSQAVWREEHGLPIGTNSQGTPIGNRVDLEYARVSGCNFLSPIIGQRVREDVATFADGERVDESRLFGNLLSSQPLCYNLFAELADDLDLATAVIRTWWPRVQRVQQIRFEFSPGRGDDRFTGTRSAFDVFIEYEGQAGDLGFVGVEMKYHERLENGGKNAVRKRPIEVASLSGEFRDARDPALTTLPLSQLFLDHTLALSMLQDSSSPWRQGHFAVIYPSINRSCRKALQTYRTHLREHAASMSSLTLEEAVSTILGITDAPWARQAKRRYLQQWPMHFAHRF